MLQMNFYYEFLYTLNHVIVYDWDTLIPMLLMITPDLL